jgi:hypothetical protein
MRIGSEVINLPPTESQKEAAKAAARKRTKKVVVEDAPASDLAFPQS